MTPRDRTESTGPLTGVMVVEFTDGLSAPFAARKLMELGAEVVKVEPRDGDPIRGWGPFPEAGPDGHGGLFAYLNANKQSITLDVETERGRDLLAELLADADVFITDDLPTLEWTDPTDIVKSAETTIACVTPYGTNGPRANNRGYGINATALAGVQIAIGEPDREPLTTPNNVSVLQGGLHAANAVLMSLLSHELNDTPHQFIDIAVADVLASYVVINSTAYLHYDNLEWRRAGHRANGSGGPYPYTILPCKDGAVCLICRSSIEWNRFVEAMGNPEWADEERYQDKKAMGSEYPDEVDEKLLPWFRQRTKAELFELAQEYGFALGPVRTMAEAIDEPHLEDRDLFDKVVDPAVGEVCLPGLPFEYSNKDLPGTMEAAPPLGHDTRAVLNELGYDADERAELRRAGVI